MFTDHELFIHAQIKENIKALRHWPLWGKFTGTGEFPAQRASNAETVPFDDVIMPKKYRWLYRVLYYWHVLNIGELNISKCVLSYAIMRVLQNYNEGASGTHFAVLRLLWSSPSNNVRADKNIKKCHCKAYFSKHMRGFYSSNDEDIIKHFILAGYITWYRIPLKSLSCWFTRKVSTLSCKL